MPYAFTEQGVYLLMTVLKGDLAIKQSRTLVRLFKSMKNYIVENQQLMIAQHDYLALAMKIDKSSGEIEEIKNRMDDMVTHADLSDFMKLFDAAKEAEEILILDGEPFKADLAYQRIYKKAKKNIILIDEYLGVKTLQHLAQAKSDVKITIISDNKGRKPLRKSEYDDFRKEYPKTSIEFIRSQNKIHDRYIAIDYGTKNMKVFHSGASVKDAGGKITTITEISDIADYKNTIKELLAGPPLVLK